MRLMNKINTMKLSAIALAIAALWPLLFTKSTTVETTFARATSTPAKCTERADTVGCTHLMHVEQDDASQTPGNVVIEVPRGSIEVAGIKPNIAAMTQVFWLPDELPLPASIA